MTCRPRIGVTLALMDPIIAKVDALVRGAIERAGGLVVVVPHSADPEHPEAVFPLLDGVVLMGGPDVEPALYGAAPHPLTRVGQPGYDVTELGLARACLTHGKPILGICRGSQVLNVAAGGTLVQDIPSQMGSDLPHAAEWVDIAKAPPGNVHDVRIERGTAVAGWLGAGPRRVNSYHHQAVDRLGDGRRAAAFAPDGVIEATESEDGAFAVGLQWHNEFHMEVEPRFQAPLAALVEAARGGR